MLKDLSFVDYSDMLLGDVRLSFTPARRVEGPTSVKTRAKVNAIDALRQWRSDDSFVQRERQQNPGATIVPTELSRRQPNDGS